MVAGAVGFREASGDGDGATVAEGEAAADGDGVGVGDVFRLRFAGEDGDVEAVGVGDDLRLRFGGADADGDAEEEGDGAGVVAGTDGAGPGPAVPATVAAGNGLLGVVAGVGLGILVPGGGSFTRRFRLFGPGSIGRTGSLIGR